MFPSENPWLLPLLCRKKRFPITHLIPLRPSLNHLPEHTGETPILFVLTPNRFHGDRKKGERAAAGAKSEWSIRTTKMRRIRQNSSRQMLYSRRYLQYLLQPAHTGCLPQERLRLADSIKDPRKFRCKVGTVPIFINDRWTPIVPLFLFYPWRTTHDIPGPPVVSAGLQSQWLPP